MAVIILISKEALMHTKDGAVDHCLVTFRPKTGWGCLFSSRHVSFLPFALLVAVQVCLKEDETVEGGCEFPNSQQRCCQETGINTD